jgi:hypothetical protein
MYLTIVDGATATGGTDLVSGPEEPHPTLRQQPVSHRHGSGQNLLCGPKSRIEPFFSNLLRSGFD